MNSSALAITVLACALLALTEGQAPLLRCQCTETVPKEISDNRIVKLEIIPPGPHCKNTEVIAIVKFRKELTLCLNPNDNWVRKIIKKRNLALKDH